MPFQSEKQRRYLWANEPEIARDWTDTYGSGIGKALGGRIGFAEGKTSIPEWNLATLKASLEFPGLSAEEKAAIQAQIDTVEGNIGTTADTLLGSGEAPKKGMGSKLLEFIFGGPVEGSEPDILEPDFGKVNKMGLINTPEGFLEKLLASTDETAADLYDSNFRYVDQKIPGINEPRIPGDEAPDSSQRYSDYNQKRNMGSVLQSGIGKAFATDDTDDDLKALSYAVEPPEQQGILEKISNLSPFKQIAKQFEHKPATTDLRYHQPDGSIRGWTKDQLDSMNALGGYYSQPMRQYRRDMGRIGYMLDRQAQGKKIGEKNLANLLQTYGGDQGGGGLSDHDLSTIGQKSFTGSGQAFEARPSGTFTTPSGEKGYSGGRAKGGLIRRGYSTGGITRLLPGKYE